jgi:hypothetical protein
LNLGKVFQFYPFNSKGNKLQFVLKSSNNEEKQTTPDLNPNPLKIRPVYEQAEETQLHFV